MEIADVAEQILVQQELHERVPGGAGVDSAVGSITW